MVGRNPDMALQRYADEYGNDPEFIAEGLAIKVTEEMLGCLEKKGQTQTWLAQKMGVSRALISRILNAPPNMTLLTIAKIAVALGVTPDVSLSAEPPRLVPAKYVPDTTETTLVRDATARHSTGLSQTCKRKSHPGDSRKKSSDGTRRPIRFA